MHARFPLGTVLVVVIFASVACDGGGDSQVGRPVPELPARPLGTDASKLKSSNAVAIAANELDGFWAAIFADLGEDFEPLEGLLSAAEMGESACGGGVSPADVAGNAVYCPSTDELVYDEQWLDSEIIRSAGGPLTVATLVAHEYGHAVQSRLDTDGPELLLELQADCFAGAWLATTLASTSTSFSATSDELAGPLRGLLRLRDAVESTARGVLSHGTGFDRLRAALTGLDEGANRCLGYLEEPPAITAQAWMDRGDAAYEGNAPLPILISNATADLDDHYRVVSDILGWSTWEPPVVVAHQVPDVPHGTALGSATAEADPVAEGCGRPAAWCSLDSVVHLDGPELGQRYATGDMAAGLAIAQAWAQLALMRAGLPESGSGVHCLSGVWLGTLFPDATQRPSRSFVLSPEDLDEVAVTILTTPGKDRMAALRSTIDGFGVGLDRCLTRTEPDPGRQ